MGASIREVVGDLREAGKSLSPWQAPSFREPATPEQIRSLEEAVGGPLPASLKAFLRLSDAVIAMDVHNGYWLGGSVELARSVRRGDFPPDVPVDGVRRRAVPVATDGGGNAFLTSVGDPRVWGWMQASGELHDVAPDFEAFLARVAEDWRHAARDDPDWDYLV